ncbi:MAG: uracil-DNA glycosylase, partial [Edwardsiella sp. (in: enterobacteria)]
TQRHRVLKAPHPSPLSAHRGFLGCRHFSMTNQLLQEQGIAPIDWQPRLPQGDAQA